VIDQRKIQLLIRLAGLLAVVILIVLSLVPGDLRPQTGAPGPFEHIVAYALTAGCLSFGFGQTRNMAVIVLCLSMLSGTVEIAQLYIPDRHSDIMDFVASSSGACIGVALAWIVLRMLATSVAWAGDV
jgi:VanZ family protein